MSFVPLSPHGEDILLLPIHPGEQHFIISSSFRDASFGGGPESITPNRGYGFRARSFHPRPGMTQEALSQPHLAAGEILHDLLGAAADRVDLDLAIDALDL